MTLLEQWQDLAAIENERAREIWLGEDARKTRPSRTRDGLLPLLGSGISQIEAARRIGVSEVSVHKTLKREGWTL